VIGTHRSTPRAELAEFLRSRRARLNPVDAGFANGSRRRTPGLRREEVAQLAEVGVSWYTWLEQGRDIHVSEPLLERLAGALRLTATERGHLFELAHGRPPSLPTIAPAEASLALRHVVDAYPFPALVSTLRWDVLAWNAPITALYGDYARLPIERRNALWSFFTDLELRVRIPSWADRARGSVARFRLDAARAADRTSFDALATELAEVSPEFARYWSEHEVIEVPEGKKVFVHPDVGAIEFEHVSLSRTEPDGQALRVTLYVPRPGESLARANKLFGLVTR
jgi:transcriptional regulator with XRE-family HTH domain